MYLRDSNNKLKEENTILRTALERLGLSADEIIATSRATTEPCKLSPHLVVLGVHSKWRFESFLLDSDTKVICYVHTVGTSPIRHGPLTPPSSDGDSVGSPSFNSASSEDGIASHPTSPSGMVDSSRVLMCVFMFTVLLVNPFRLVMFFFVFLR